MLSNSIRQSVFLTRLLSAVIFCLVASVALLPVSAQQTEPHTSSPQEQKLDQLNKQGLEAYNKGDAKGALDAWQEGLTKALSLGDQKHQEKFLNNLGIAYSSTGQSQKALDYFTRALALSRKLNDSTYIVKILHNLGAVYSNLGQFDKALDNFQQALAVEEKIGDASEIASTLSSLGTIYSELGQNEKALDFYKQALATAEKLGNPVAVAGILYNLGSVYYHIGNRQSARDFQLRSLTLFEKVGDIYSQTRNLIALGQISQEWGDLDAASAYFYQALANQERIGDRSGTASILRLLAGVMIARAKLDQANAYLNRSLILSRQIQNRSQEGETFFALGELAEKKGESTSALGQFENALAIFLELKSTASAIKSLDHLARIATGKGDLKASLKYRERQLELQKQEKASKIEINATRAAIDDTQRASRSDNPPPDPMPSVRPGITYALLIATDIYDNWPKLANPVEDAKALEEELREAFGFHTELILNPTQQVFMSKVVEYANKKFKDGDQLLIFIAGHGTFDETLKEGYILVKDSKRNDVTRSSFIPHSVIRTYFDAIPCQHVLLIMDACFGGTFDRSVAVQEMRGADPFEEASSMEREKFITRKLKYKTRRYITSGGKEYVSDGIPGRHSPFARNLLEALAKYEGPKHLLTFHGLLECMQNLSPEPRYGDFGGNDPLSDFLFLHAPAKDGQ